MQLFLVRMKNVQTDINHQPWNLISALFTQHFDPLSNKETRRKQQSNSKMQNSWLTIKTGKMSWNKSTFSLESSVIKVLRKFSSKALFSVCLYFSWLHVWIACENRRFSSLIAAGGRFARRNVCDSATEIPYWWRKISPESGHQRWLDNRVVTLVWHCFWMTDKGQT